MIRYFMVALLSIGFVGCSTSTQEIVGSGKIVKENRTVQGFNKIDVNGVGNLYVSQTGEESLTIEADDNIVNLVSSEIKNNTLYIEQKPSSEVKLVKTSRPINYYVTVKDIKEISLSGTGNVITQGVLNANELSIKLSGAGTGNIEVNASRVTTDLSGSGEFTVKGKADNQEINISGTGNYNGADLICKLARIEISGLGKVVVNVQENLNVRISGTGSIFYIGNPRIQESISGSGKLEQLDKQGK